MFQNKGGQHSVEQRINETEENENVPNWAKNFYGTSYRNFTVMWNEMITRWHQNAPFTQSTSWKGDSFQEGGQTTSESTSIDLRSSKDKGLFRRRRSIAILVTTVAVLLVLGACIVSAVLIDVILVTPPKNATVEARLKARITNRPFTEELLNKTSAEFQQFQKDFCFEVQQKINEDTYCLVTDLKNGSIIVEFIIITISWNAETSNDIHIKNIIIEAGTFLGPYRLTEIDALYNRVIVEDSIPSDAISYKKDRYSSTSTNLNGQSQTSIFTGKPDTERYMSSTTYPAYSSSYRQILETSSEIQKTFSADHSVLSDISSQLKTISSRFEEQLDSINTTPSTGQPDTESEISSTPDTAYSSYHTVSNEQILETSEFQKTFSTEHTVSSDLSSQLKTVSSRFEEPVNSTNSTPATLDSKHSVTESSHSTFQKEITTTVMSSMQSANIISSESGTETLSFKSVEPDVQSLDLTSTKYNEAISPTPSSSDILDASATFSLVTSEQKIVITEESQPSTFLTGNEMKSMQFSHSASDPSSVFVITSQFPDTQIQAVSSSDASIKYKSSTSYDSLVIPSTTELKASGQSSSNYVQDESISVSASLSYSSKASFQSEDHLSTLTLIGSVNTRGSEPKTTIKSNSKSQQFSTSDFLDIQETSMHTSTYSQETPESSESQLTYTEVSDHDSSYLDSTNKIENTEYTMSEHSDTGLGVPQSRYPDATYSSPTTEYGLTYMFDSSNFNHVIDGTSALVTAGISSSSTFVIENNVNIQNSLATTGYNMENISFSESYTETSAFQMDETSHFFQSASESLYTAPPEVEEPNGPAMSASATGLTTTYEGTYDDLLMSSSNIDAVSTGMDTIVSTAEFFEESNLKITYSTSVLTLSQDMSTSISSDVFSKRSMDISSSSTFIFTSATEISSIADKMSEEFSSFLEDYSLSPFSTGSMDISPSTTFKVTPATEMTSLADIISKKSSSFLENISSTFKGTSATEMYSLAGIISEEVSSFLEENSHSSIIDATVVTNEASEFQSATLSLLISYSSADMDIAFSSIDINNEMLSSDFSSADTSALLVTSSSMDISTEILSSDFTDTSTLGMDTYNVSFSAVSASHENAFSSALIPSSTDDFMMSSSSYMTTETPGERVDVGVQNVVIYQNESLSITCNLTNAVNFTLIFITVNDEEVGRITAFNSSVKSPWTLTNKSSSDYQLYYLEVVDTNCTTTGYYTCGVYGDWGVVQQKASIEVRVRPGTPELTFPDELVENRVIKQNIQCEVDAGVPTANVTWSVTFNNGTTIEEYDFSQTNSLNDSTSCTRNYSSSFRRSFSLDWHNSSICCNLNHFGLKTSTCKDLFIVPENFCIVNNGSTHKHPYDDCYLFITCGSATFVTSCRTSRYCFDPESKSCSREPDLDPNQDNDPYSCDGKANNVFIPVRNDCNAYIWCVNGQRFQRLCAGETLYKSTDDPCTDKEEESYCAKQNP